MIKNIIFSFVALTFLAVTAEAGTQTPSSVKIKLKQFWVSKSKQCSNPTLLYTNPNPTVGVEITTAPDLGTGSITPGTYECVIIVMSDSIEYKATATGGTCTAGQTYTKDLCRSPDTSVSVGGATVNCADGTEDTMTLYVSTASTGGGAMAPPTTDSNDPNGETLTTPLVVTAGEPASGTFRFSTTNALSDVHANCSPENISFAYVP